MATFCAAMEVAKTNLEEIDSDTKTSDNELGYWALEKSGLDKDEKQMVLARADETFKLSEVSDTLKNMFPRGSPHRGKDARPREHRRRRASHEEAEARRIKLRTIIR